MINKTTIVDKIIEKMLKEEGIEYTKDGYLDLSDDAIKILLDYEGCNFMLGFYAIDDFGDTNEPFELILVNKISTIQKILHQVKAGTFIFGYGDP